VLRVKKVVLAGLLLLGCWIAIAQSQRVHLDDDSDWWSLVRRERYPDPDQVRGIKPQHRQLPESTFHIVGVTSKDSREATLGTATEVERGDGASGRQQFCYSSPADNVHLVFEYGEVESAFILFRGGEDWNGSKLCLASPAVSARIGTGSGLRLDMDRKQVLKILGDPNLSKPDKLVYYITYRRRPAADDPRGSEFIEVEDYIELHFEDSRLTYLAVSRTES
jgi:hypothetical protein